MDDYLPIEDYGVIGDLSTAALVGLNGSIDFMCFPEFESPSIFCAMLDKNKGGNFEILPPPGNVKNRQMYLPDTNVLLTRFLSADGVGEIVDYMPISEEHEGHALVRRLTQVRGQEEYQMNFRPRFNYARSEHKVERKGKSLIFTSLEDEGLVIRLTSNVPLKIKRGDGYAKFTLRPEETADFVMEKVDYDGPLRTLDADFVEHTLFETVNYWKRWIARSKYKGRWQETVNRSALVLKLMTSRRHGSIVASPTFGLPEKIGGDKNWDYRYSWIRDSAFTLYALIRLGYTREADAFMKWLRTFCKDLSTPGALGLMYSAYGNKNLEEIELTHLEGYKKSYPVRIGNAAYNQLQLDIYGELMDSVYLYDKYGDPISYHMWNDLAGQINWVCENWQRPDEGIWEVRGGRREFLYSRLMCWVAVDRGIRLATKRSYPMPNHWHKVRDEMYYSIHNEFWNEKMKTFVQYKGADRVDAATLIMPLVRFISPKDERWLSTLARIEKDLVSDSLVYRYCPKHEELTGLKSGEGTFSLCSFWYVECLSRAGYLQKARLYFEKMLGYSSHLGLYGEQLGFQGEHLGNFPQAFTHLGLISAAYNLDLQLDDERNKEARRNNLYI
ncbi:MAG: Trehalase [Chlamydiae bacterium]|nr:Trehalase [Chlamydiota bacterium]